ncbi:hypothetical protein ACFQH6_07090 [Halobacteriaceae archaeon GCM10025711]
MRTHRLSLSRRRFLAAAVATLAAPASLAAATSRVRGDDTEFRRGSTDRCDRFVSFEDADEEVRHCSGPDGTVHEMTDADGDEERREYDANGTLRLEIEEDADGEEERREYDANGTLRLEIEEDADGEEERREYDANGTLRFFHREDEDGDEVTRRYDENGVLVESSRDDDDDDD